MSAPEPTTGATGGAACDCPPIHVYPCPAMGHQDTPAEYEARAAAVAAVPSPETAPTEGLRWYEVDALARALHNTWHIGCQSECGGRLDDSIKTSEVLAPAVARILAARAAADRAKVARVEQVVNGATTLARIVGDVDPAAANAIRSLCSDLRRALDGEGT